MDMALDGSLNRHGGQADGVETGADERARERAEAVQEAAHDLFIHSPLGYGAIECLGCEESIVDARGSRTAHLATCELLRARAEAEVDRAER